MKTIVNLTPHKINITTPDGVIVYPPSGEVARREEFVEIVEPIIVGGSSIAQRKISYGPVIGLPEPSEGVIYIVSSLAAAGSNGREDVRIPGPGIRDGEGRITGCDGLCIPGVSSITPQQAEVLAELIGRYEIASYESAWGKGDLAYAEDLIRRVDAAFGTKAAPALEE
jgi:hypothetical protein